MKHENGHGKLEILKLLRGLCIVLICVFILFTAHLAGRYSPLTDWILDLVFGLVALAMYCNFGIAKLNKVDHYYLHLLPIGVLLGLILFRILLRIV